MSQHCRVSAMKRDNLTIESLSSKRAVISPTSVATTSWVRSTEEWKSAKTSVDEEVTPDFCKKTYQKMSTTTKNLSKQFKKINLKKRTPERWWWWWSWGVTFTHVTAAVVRSLKQHSVTTVHTATPVTFTLHQAGLTSRGRKRQIVDRQETASN